jgi:hypothetical protein
MARSIMVRWEEGSAAGFTDILPLEWFATEGASLNRTHVVEGNWPGGNARRLAQFDLKVDTDTADLNYENYRGFNDHRSMLIGIMRLCFTDSSRVKVQKVLWKDLNDEEYKQESVSITIGEPPPTDLVEPPERAKTLVYRVIRDTAMSQEVKQLCGWECQICGHAITMPDGTRYAEAHHIQPLGGEHNGPDIRENIICVCPNHHVELDYGIREIRVEDLLSVPAHEIAKRYIDYHNEKIFAR